MGSCENFTKVERGEGKKKPMKLITVHMPEEYVDGLKKLVDQGKYFSVSEAVRVAVRRFLRKESSRWLPRRMIA